MRPAILNPLFAPAASLPGIGEKLAKLYERLLAQGGQGARVIDLLFHLPQATVDRRDRPKIAQAERDRIVTLEVKIVEHLPPPHARWRAPYRVLVEDETGDLQLVFFLANHNWIAKSLPVGEKRWVSGKLELWEGHLQMVHPDRVLDAAGLARLPPVEPVYGLTEGLGQRAVQRAIEAALPRVPDLPEWLDPAFKQTHGLPTFGAALRAVHRPDAPAAIEPGAVARLRLAYDELLASQLALSMMRAHLRNEGGRASPGDRRIAARIEQELPFSLTLSQDRALAEIRADLATDKRMMRLLQGDVGSGKTIVALLAMTSVVEAGRQAALMAPTEILARQHHERIAPLAAAAGLKLALLTGRDRASERTRTLDALAAGEIDILVGTHALIQESVAFKDLAFVVVDEQHRFGVHQRLALGEKGESVDVLVMTATPIPRTLVLTYFGDMDVSTLHEKPAGRMPIDTRALPLDRLSEVVAGVGRAVSAGARVYWICPLVEENEEVDAAAAEQRAESLRLHFGDRVGLLHGRMKGRDKDAAMSAFQAGETDILVATTIVEVGVDVPEATVMVIEHAERFGLAQLHQMRGRIGRGSGKSTCILLYKAPLGEIAKARIGVMRETEDGFRIAEEDLKLRGEGEVLGTRQSGTPGFRLADITHHAELLTLARDDARQILESDPNLTSGRGAALRVLLYVFEREAAVRLLRAG
ncbi:MAG TPA: ATP-dependent DNA helicase RecG [Beijerinckiaceae bacterium]|nr:ATP-dependent DNA helicase RecG [Beijerinckiaceae bacterium]